MNNLWVWLLQHILDRYYWYDNYYPRSNHWRKLRERKIKQVKRRCEYCGRLIAHNQVFHVHHKLYYRNGKSILWHEKLNDLQVLHEDCHKKIHNVKG